jgi:small subunit ribosomal protein S16
VAVRIRMKKMGRRHRPFYRICAIDSRSPRNGRAIEELGTYDPMIPDTDARAVLVNDRIKYWLSVGATPSDKVGVLIKKYGPEGTRLEEQTQALDRLAQSRRRREVPAELPEAVPLETPAEPVAEEAPAEPVAEDTPTEAPAEAPAVEAPAAEAPAAEEPKTEAEG